jgi:hypothetical protein
MKKSLDTLVVSAHFKHYISTSDGGFWLICNRPFQEAATDMLRSAIRACKPVPTVLGRRRNAIASI